MQARTRNRCRERLTLLAHADLDPDEARRTAIEELRRAVGFDRWCWPLTDPDSGLAMSGIAQFDIWPSLPRLVALEQHGDVLSKPHLIVGPRASTALTAVTSGDLARSRVWRECLRPYGIGDTLLTACREHNACWGTFELMRDSDDRPFSDEEVGLLDDLAPTLARLLRRTLALRWRDDTPDAVTAPPGTLIVNRDLSTVGWTPAVRQWVDQLVPHGAMLPAAVYEIAARVLAQDAGGPGHPLDARVRIRTSSGGWSVMEGAPLEGGDEACVAITVRAATADEVADILCSAHAVTPRERELIALLRRGLATKQVSGRLGISSHTVQDHLKAIFAKMGVRSRRELISRFVGSVPSGEARDTKDGADFPESRRTMLDL